MADEQRTQNTRFKEVITKCRRQAQLFVSSQLRELLYHTDEALTQFLEKARSDEIQTRLTEAQAILEQNRAQVETLFLREFQAAFLALLHPQRRSDPVADRESQHQGGAELSLVGHDQMDEAVAMENLISKVNDTCFSELYALQQRLAVINGGRRLEKKELPAGPHHLVYAFHVAIDGLDIDIKVKLILYALLEKYVTRQIKRLYIELNATLKEAGILPNLKEVIRRQAAADVGTQSPPTSDGMRREGTGPQNLGDELFDTILDLMTATSSRDIQNSAAAIASAGLETAAGASVVAQLSSLVNAIGKIQFGSVLSYGRVSSGEEASPQVAMDPLFIEKSKNILSRERTQIFEQLGPQQISPVDADIIDIVGMMFEYMLNDLLLPNVAKALISRLHTPYLKVALIDPRLRTDTTHPARQFLDLLVEAGCQYVDESDTSRGIFPEMRKLVERVLAEFSDNTELFGELVDTLESAVNEQRRKTTSIEQRAQQAIKGQEKLLLARQTAAKAMAVRANRPFLPKEAVSFLTAVWIDRLVFILLREEDGENSDDWKDALGIADALVNSFNPAEFAKDRKILEGLLPKLCSDIEAELRSLGGRFPEAWRALSAILSDPQAVLQHAKQYGRRTPPATAPERGSEAAARPTSADVAPVGAQSRAKDAVSETPITREEQRLIDEFRDLPYGTWVEFAANGDSLPRRLKLSWFSPVTGTCMFVDTFGRKAETKPIRSVTADIMAKRAKIIRQSTQPFFERALQSILEMLRIPPKPAPGPHEPMATAALGRSSASAGSQA